MTADTGEESEGQTEPKNPKGFGLNSGSQEASEGHRQDWSLGLTDLPKRGWITLWGVGLKDTNQETKCMLCCMGLPYPWLHGTEGIGNFVTQESTQADITQGNPCASVQPT